MEGVLFQEQRGVGIPMKSSTIRKEINKRLKRLHKLITISEVELRNMNFEPRLLIESHTMEEEDIDLTRIIYSCSSEAGRIELPIKEITKKCYQDICIHIFSVGYEGKIKTIIRLYHCQIFKGNKIFDFIHSNSNRIGTYNLGRPFNFTLNGAIGIIGNSNINRLTSYWLNELVLETDNLYFTDNDDYIKYLAKEWKRIIVDNEISNQLFLLNTKKNRAKKK